MKGFVPQGFDVGSGEGLFGRDADGSARTWTAEEVYDWLWPDGLDADTLEGHSASYFATATAIANMATASAVIADNVLVRGDGGARGIQGSGITVDDSNNIFGVVGITATGKIATTLTTEQLRLAYDATHYAPFTVGSTGILTIAPYNAGAASYVSVTGRLGVGTASPGAVIEAALSTGVIGVKGTSDSTYGGYFISSSGTGLRGDSTSGTGVYGLSSSYYGGWFASTTSRGIYVTTRSGIGAYVRKTGTLTASESSEMLYLLRDVDGASSYATTGNLITINDGPTNCTSISGYMLTAIFSGTERVRFNPRVADGASAVAYFWDTNAALSTAGAKLASWRNNGVEKAAVYYDGQGYFASTLGVGTSSGSYRFTSYNASANSEAGIVSGSTYSTIFHLETATNEWSLRSFGSGSAYSGKFAIQDGSDVRIAIDTAGKIGLGTPSPGYFVEIKYLGTAKSVVDFLSINNTVNAADMDGTGTAILFRQYYYDAGTPAVADAGRIAVITETDWTSTASTRDSYMRFSTALDGTVSEKVRIDSAGNVGVGMTPTYKLDVTGNLRCSTGFGCNGATPQTAYASGGDLAAYATGAYGFDSDAHASALHAMVVSIRAALVANGIMS